MPGTIVDDFTIGGNFNGYITELNIFDSFLGHQRMAAWTSCSLMERGNVFSWDPRWFNLTNKDPDANKKVSVESVRTHDFCLEEKEFTYQVIHDKEFQNEQKFAMKTCKRVNGELIAPPTTVQEMIEIMEISDIRLVYFWTTARVRRKPDFDKKDSYPANGTYEYYDEVTGETLEVLRKNKNPYFVFHPEESTYTYIPELCVRCGHLRCINEKCSKKSNYGALCKTKKHISFQLSGLCEQSTVDRKYRLVQSPTPGQKNTYVGAQGWKMVYSEELNVWTVSHRLYPDKNLTMKSNDRLPAGRFRWEIANSTCNEGLTEIRTLQVSNCREDQFTCDDGSCVPMLGRCDSIGHCEDVSDEKQCKLVNIDKNKYLKDRPPTPLNTDKFQVNVSINIRSVLDIQEVGMVLKLLFNLDLSWFDNRLQFYNLKDDDNMNTLSKIDQETVWTPTVLFDNTEKQLTSQNDEKSFAKVIKLGNSTRSGSTYDEDIDIFEGKENLLLLSRSYDIEFICEYDMR